MTYRGVLVIVLVLFPIISFGQVFKCIENGKTVYTQQPCSTNSSQSSVLVNVTQNPDTFDIAGVKLGMIEAQTIKAITSTLGITKSDISIHQRGKAKAYEFSHTTGKYLISFWDNLDNPQQKIVVSIMYEIKVPPPETGGVTKIRTDLIKKYGKPSVTNQNGDSTSFQWCGIVQKNEHCFEKEGIQLIFTGHLLMLSNDKYTQPMLEEQAEMSKTYFK